MRLILFSFASFSLIIVASAIDETADLIFTLEAASAPGNENDFLWRTSEPLWDLATGEPDLGISTDESLGLSPGGSDFGSLGHDDLFTFAILDDQWSLLDSPSDCSIDGSAMGMMRRETKCPAPDDLIYPSEDTPSSPVANPDAPVCE